MHPLARILLDAATGAPPAADGTVRIVPSTGGRLDAVVGFPAHLVISADLESADITTRFRHGDFDSWTNQDHLAWLAARTGRTTGQLDIILAATPTLDAPALDLVRRRDFRHPRVVRASRYRADIQVFTTPDDACVLVLGRGLCGRLEVAFEVAPDQRGRGYGRVLARAARAIADTDRVWAQVAPANTSSLRALLAAGYVPIGTEVLMAAPAAARSPHSSHTPAG